MQNAYGKYGKLLSGVFSFLLLIGFTSIMAKVAGSLLSAFTGLSLGWSAIIVVGVVVLYTYFGGMRGSVYTDAYQTVIFGVALIMLLLVSMYKSSIGFSGAVSQGIDLGVGTISAMSFLAILGFVFSMMFGEVFLPPMVGRALSAKNAGVSKKTFITTGILTPVILFFVLLIGIFASNGIIGLETVADNAAMTIAGTVLGAGFFGFFLIALLSIVMSSLDSLLQAGAVVASNDVFFWKEEDSSKKLTISRLATVVLGILGAILALYIPDLISTLLILYAIWIPVMVIPFLYALFSKRATPSAGILSMILGGTSAYLWEFTIQSPGGLPGVIFGTIVSLIVMEVVLSFKKTSVA